MTATRTNWRARAERAEAALRTLLTLAEFERGGALTMPEVAARCRDGLGAAEGEGKQEEIER